MVSSVFRKFTMKSPENGSDRWRLVLIGFRTARYIGNGDIYKCFSTSSLVQVRWAALESLMEGIWLRQSDVWSLAVTMWEMFTQGATPCKTLESPSMSDMIQFLRAGERLDIPSDVPSSVAEMMRECWNVDIFKRPTATAIINVLDDAIAVEHCEGH